MKEWRDHKFQWDPNEYGGVTELYVPSEIIWLPDIVLYNNADGEYIVTTMTKAVLHYDGRVVWNPPAIFKSSCEIDVSYFPFDQQYCFMKFGSWTYDGFLIDLKHLDARPGKNSVKVGIDLREYYPSVEWDIMDVPAIRNEKFYPCCKEPYPDIYFNITLRRKTLFYTVNLIIPCVGLEILSVLVFYLPAYSGEKVALCISILLSQTMFFLLISEIMPSTSLALPLLGKYLLFSMILVGLSVLVTIIVLNIHYRNPSTHRMAPWVKKLFICKMPAFLLMRVPSQNINENEEQQQEEETDEDDDEDTLRDEDDHHDEETGRSATPASTLPRQNGSRSAPYKGRGGRDQLSYIETPYEGLRSHSLEDVSIEVPSIPPPPVVSRNFKNLLTAPNKEGTGRPAKGEGRIGSYIVEKRIGEDARGRDEDSSVSEGSCATKGSSRFAINGKSFRAQDGAKGNRFNPRNPDNRPKNNRPNNQKSTGGGRKSEGGKKESNLRFSNVQDKRNGGSHSAKRIINSGRLVLEASYDELPECFHIGHNPEFFYPPEIRRAIHNVQFIHSHMVQQDKFDENDDDWAFVAMVLDRLLLWVFFSTSLIGTLLIFLESPYLFDTSQPIDVQISKVARAVIGTDDLGVPI
ncbi:Neurotransmitter-gated ion-channel ligand-binding domain [Trinorchestia longiramus]|nr:Neurotransmitter-gated ion-channel ligand-binding domain [Trinorchestia longiramus]